MFCLIGTAFALRNFRTLTMAGDFTRVFGEIAVYWFLEGSGHLEKFQAPTDNLFSSKKLKLLFLVLVSKNVFSSKKERFRPLVCSSRGAH